MDLVKKLFKAALEKMLETGEFDKIAKHQPEHADFTLYVKDELSKLESMDELMVVPMLAALAEHEPVSASALSFMMFVVSEVDGEYHEEDPDGGL